MWPYLSNKYKAMFQKLFLLMNIPKENIKPKIKCINSLKPFCDSEHFTICLVPPIQGVFSNV